VISSPKIFAPSGNHPLNLNVEHLKHPIRGIILTSIAAFYVPFGGLTAQILTTFSHTAFKQGCCRAKQIVSRSFNSDDVNHMITVYTDLLHNEYISEITPVRTPCTTLMGEVVNVLVAFAVIVFIFRWATSSRSFPHLLPLPV